MTLKVDFELFGVESDGKETKVKIVCSTTGEIFEGVSHKNDADGFNMQVGYNIALRRAIMAMVNDNMNYDNNVDGDGIDNPNALGYITDINE